MGTTRRRFLTGAAAAGAVLVAHPGGALAGSLGTGAGPGATRASRITPGRWLVHADLHNHSLFSDGDGDPADAFASMRDHGIDVAALTDHAVLGGPLGLGLGAACGNRCTSVRGIDDDSWAQTGALADEADQDGVFTAIRGFEWSSPTLGHMNVWFGDDWIDPERTGGLVGLEGLPGYLQEVPGLGPAVGEPLDALVRDLPLVTGAMMRPFFEWLLAQPGSPILGGGSDALVGFNHPGREPGRFGRFHFDARLRDRVVSLELFNRSEDYLFEGTDHGQPSPLVECLAAGWRPGVLGVTDEHGTTWGDAPDKGRGGLWVTELSRAGVHEALRARRFFATREAGLRLDVLVGGGSMGTTIAHPGGPVEIVIDLDGGAEWTHRELVVQVLGTGDPLPTVLDEVDVVVPAPHEPLIRFRVPLEPATTDWVVLRVLDPDGAPDQRAAGPLGRGRALAYSSPVHVVAGASDPAGGAVPPPPGARPNDPPEPAPLPATGAGQQLPATGHASGPAAIAAGLALGAGLAGVSVLRRTAHDHGPHGHGPHGHGEVTPAP